MAEQNKKPNKPDKKPDSLKNRLLSFQEADKGKLNLEFEEDELEGAFEQMIQPKESIEPQLPKKPESAKKEEVPAGNDGAIEIGLDNISMDDLNLALDEYDKKITTPEPQKPIKTESPKKEALKAEPVTELVEGLDISVTDVLDEYDEKTTQPSKPSGKTVKEKTEFGDSEEQLESISSIYNMKAQSIVKPIFQPSVKEEPTIR